MSSTRQIIARAVIYLLGLLCLAAGIPKLMQMPQELTFLAALGLSALGVSVLGCIQCIGGLLLFWSRTRLAGALLAGVALLVSAVALLIGGNLTFGLVSPVPLVLLAVAVYLDRKARADAA